MHVLDVVRRGGRHFAQARHAARDVVNALNVIRYARLTREEVGTIRQMEIVSGSYPEALTYFPEPEAFLLGPEKYLDQVRQLKQAVRIPVIASLNGATPGGWVTFATRIAEAGADALELNLYDLGAHDGEPGFSLERRFLEIVRSVKAAVRIP